MSVRAEIIVPDVPAPLWAPWAGALSYVVPGLGQIAQGRVGKGLLFMVCLYGMFFYGWYLGHWTNVYVPPSRSAGGYLPQRVGTSMLLRLPFLCQFWIGAAAWPAILQYAELVPPADTVPFLHDLQRTPSEALVNRLQTEGDKTWDLGLVYTMIAGILNILVIYDAVAGPAFVRDEEAPAETPPNPVPETASA